MVQREHSGCYLRNVLLVTFQLQLYTEMIFVGPTYRDAMTFRQTGSNVYLYSFDYLAPGAYPTLQNPLRGIPHAWEIQYLFGYPATGAGGWHKTADDVATMNYFGQFWANFVITGYFLFFHDE
jgi:carboxylesterase type B